MTTPTTYWLLDRLNPDHSRRRTQWTTPMLHRWHALRRGERLADGNVIVGFHRGDGGMYVDYGPSVDEVCGWRRITAKEAT